VANLLRRGKFVDSTCAPPLDCSRAIDHLPNGSSNANACPIFLLDTPGACWSIIVVGRGQFRDLPFSVSPLDANHEVTMAPKLTGIDHIHVFVSDRVAAEHWYRRVLGRVRAHALDVVGHRWWAIDDRR
jgi:hypothetical protein